MIFDSFTIVCLAVLGLADVCNSVKQSPPATAAICCKLISLLSVVTSQKMADTHEVLCCNRSWKALEINGLRKRLREILGVWLYCN